MTKTTLTKNGINLKGWMALDEGTYGADAVKAGGRWFAIYDRNQGRVIGRPLNCLTYYRVDFGPNGASETRLIVAEDETAKLD